MALTRVHNVRNRNHWDRICLFAARGIGCMKVLVTGVAGFIGAQTARTLLARGDDVIGLDNLNDYYDVNLKLARLARLQGQNNFHFVKADLADRHEIERVFEEHRPERVINLAAQAGVRYAFENPHSYVDSNLVGFLHILEGCRHHGVQHLVYASSSSVYGANTRMPFSIHDNVDHPLNLYAASKKANELMAHSYSHLYKLPVTGLRFFTVYGPWGRPDMSLFLFTKKIIAGEPIDVFNFGQHARDFTFIDDIVEGVVRTLDKVATPNPDWNGAEPDPGTSAAPYRLYNIGNNQPVELMYFIECIEKAVGKKALKNMLPLQPGDVPRTFADVDALVADIGFQPKTPIEEGVQRFVDWYRDFYRDALETLQKSQPEPTVIQTRGALRDLRLRPRIKSREGCRYRSGPKADVPRHGRLVFRFTSARTRHRRPSGRV